MNRRLRKLLPAGLLLTACLLLLISQHISQCASQQVRPRRVVSTQGKLIFVKAGSKLQAALEAAQPGDTIVLEAGATFVGPITLPAKTGDAFITIESSRLAELPGDGQRVAPEHAALMPKIVSPGGNQAALRTAAYAHHYRLRGIELMPKDAAVYLRELVQLGSGDVDQDTLARVPHHLVLDRCYIHAWPEQELIRGIALNSAHTEITNCYIADFKSKGFDSQAVWGWNGPGPFRIINNYLEGAGENAGFGGAVPAITGLVPSDIEFRGNHVAKPVSWRGKWLVKNLFEFKSAQRAVIDGNLFENNWANAQAGYAILLTVRAEDCRAPWNAIRDVEFTNNIVRHTGSGMQLLGRDDAAGCVSERMERVRVANNLFEDVDGGRWGGSGIFLLMIDTKDVAIDHNTVLHSGNITTAVGAASEGFVFTNNVMRHNEYGVFGGGASPGNLTLETYFPGARFRRNLIAGGQQWRYPADNYYPGELTAAGFVDQAAGNYRLATSSRYKGKATDGKDIGCDLSALEPARAAGSRQ